jgi:2-polyprenyl-3-methyl-5-hydroxy-6-metoxy-1,4-benzoquinol methylase
MNETSLLFEQLKSCPVCTREDFSPYLTCRDYIATQETFTLLRCTNCGLVFTNPRPAETAIGRYYESENYMPHVSGKKTVLGTIYRAVRKYAVGRKLALINSLSRRGRLLDIGCGTGEFLKRCNTDGWQTFGVEPSEGARETTRQGGATVQPVLRREDYAPASLDVVTMWHALEHIHDPRGTASIVTTLLKPGGVFLVAVPNHTCHDARVYGPLWGAYDVPRHLHHFSPAAMQRLMESAGLQQNRTLPMWFDSVYVSLMSERYRRISTGRGSAARAVCIGLSSNIRAWLKPGTCSSQIYIFTKKGAN